MLKLLILPAKDPGFRSHAIGFAKQVARRSYGLDVQARPGSDGPRAGGWTVQMNRSDLVDNRRAIVYKHSNC
jgi:hypothetical protein